MFRIRSGEGRSPARQSSSSPTGHGGPSAGPVSQESSWLSLLSAVSRPALTFLQRYVPGRVRHAAPHGGDIDSVLFTDMMATPHLTYLQYQHDAAAALLEPGPHGDHPLFTAASLRDIGIQGAEETEVSLQKPRDGYLSSFRTLLSHVLSSTVSSEDTTITVGGQVRTSMSSVWWSASSKTPLLSNLSLAENQLRPQHQGQETKTESTAGENTGLIDHKDQLNDNGPHVVQNTGGSASDHQLNISHHLSCPGAVSTCSEVTLLTPDQDNGYSSLEEEQVQTGHLVQEPQAPADENCAAVMTETETALPEDTASVSVDLNQEHVSPQDGPPSCQNKAIAFIMGYPCSDDDCSQSDDTSSDDDDDDGFDSERPSDLSDSTDEDDDEASDLDIEVDSSMESDRLWNSLCQSVDPYNPQNFTAELSSSSSSSSVSPRSICTPTPPSFTHAPLSCASDPHPPSPAASPPPAIGSPPSGDDIWDDSTSGSEVDEAESQRLWSSFTCSSDPYSPLNFQAPLRTQVPLKASPRAKAKKPSHPHPHSPPHKAASPLEYRKEEAEERLDSGFSEPSFSAVRSSPTRTVNFCDKVEVFFATCGEEERRGPWEQMARDRCRFLRRCMEVEQSISYCLQPEHRRQVYCRLNVCDVQDA